MTASSSQGAGNQNWDMRRCIAETEDRIYSRQKKIFSGCFSQASTGSRIGTSRGHNFRRRKQPQPAGIPCRRKLLEKDSDINHSHAMLIPVHTHALKRRIMVSGYGLSLFHSLISLLISFLSRPAIPPPTLLPL